MEFVFSQGQMVGLAVVVGLLALLAAAGAVSFFYRKDTKIEGRRKEAIKIAEFFTKLGLPHTAGFFNDYAVGDYSGMWSSAKAVLKILDDPAQRKAAVRQVVTGNLDVLSDDQVGSEKNAIELSHFFDRLGLSVTSGFFTDYAANDLPGMRKSIDTVLKIIRDPEQRAAVAKRVVYAQLPDLLKDTAEYAKVKDLLAKAAPPQAAVPAAAATP